MVSIFFPYFYIWICILTNLHGLVVNACIKIHSKVGPGCFERVYEEILYYEIDKAWVECKTTGIVANYL